MHIDLDTLFKVPNIEQYALKVDPNDRCIPVLYSTLEKAGLEKTTDITTALLHILRENVIKGVSIHSTGMFLRYLRKEYPEQFLQPTGQSTVKDLIKHAEEYDQMNNRSNKKRTVRVMEDIYNMPHGFTGRRKLIVEYDTVITPKVIDALRASVHITEEVQYKDSESGVLVFVPDVKKFKLKVDLFAIVADIDHDIEIYDAATIKEALEIYRLNSPKMVIMGDLSGNKISKELSLRLESWDPYIKKINYDESPAANRDDEKRRIKKMIDGPYLPIIQAIEKNKDPLPDKLKEIVNESLSSISKNWTHDAYVELAFAIRQFGRMFNISVYWNRLLSLRKDHELFMMKQEEEEEV